MTAQDLKNAILQLAVQGKLAPQDPTEGEADVRGIKQKPMEELDFDIPQTWKTAHIECISNTVPSKQFQILESEVRKTGRFPVISQSKEYTIGFTDVTDRVFHHDAPVIAFGDHTTEVKYITFDFVVGADGVKIFEPNTEIVFPQFLYYTLLYYTIGLNKVGGYSRHYKFIKNKPIPIPPFSEQQRIVAKIEELMPLVEEYRKAEERLTALNAEFPDKLRKSILQQAIQGKLTERDPADESASELLKRIRAEKERLIKEGKIKKEKPLPPITDEEMSFEIPENWEWVRLGDLGETQTGTTPSTKDSRFFGKDIPFIKPADIFCDHINYDNEGLSYLGSEQSRIIQANSVMMVCIGGSIGKTYHNDRDVCCNQQINTITPIQCNTMFIWLVLSSNYFFEALQFRATGTATPIVNKNLWCNIPVPLPPLAEQQRIVDRVNELLAVCDELK